MALEYKQLKNTDDALKLCGTLLTLEKAGTRPFCFVWQELMSCIAKGNYVIQVSDNSPVGFAAWIPLNMLLSEIYVKDLRWITPMEHGTGDVAWLHMLCAPIGDKAGLLEKTRKLLNNQQFAYASKGVKYDIHNSNIKDVLRLIENE